MRNAAAALDSISFLYIIPIAPGHVRRVDVVKNVADGADESGLAVGPGGRGEVLVVEGELRLFGVEFENFGGL